MLLSSLLSENTKENWKNSGSKLLAMGESLSSVKIQPRGKKTGPLLVGISTRSTTRMSYHQNASAVTRSDPVSSKPVTDAAESVDAFVSLSCSDASRVSSIKDLRMKRIFTPEVNSVADEETEGENEERKKVKVSDSGRVADPDADSVKVNEFEKLGLLKSGVEDERNVTANGLNSGNGSKMALSRCNSRKVFKAASSFSYRRMLPYLMDMANDASCVSKIEIVDGVNSEVKIGVDDLKPLENQDIQTVHMQKDRENHTNGVNALMEEHVQTTPPDPGMFVKTTFGHGAESLESNKLLSENQYLMRLKSPNTKCNNNSMNKSVLNPCSRLRLFKNSRSLSYKRLLPFLMDISKDNSCATMNTQNPILQKPVLDRDNNVNKSKAENSSEKQNTQDLASSLNPLPPSDYSSLDPNDILLSSMPDSSSPNCSSNLESNTSETLPEEILQSEPSSIINSDVLTKQCASEEPETVGKQNMCLDMGLELHNSNAESIEKVCLNRNLFEVEASSDVSACPNNRLGKGILKKNPLGCRGLCNCLNCASFRLHADRAFEFSRNQMHNAEEVASELMEELANLRFLLEKSITKNDSVCIQLNPNLVKQACDKALEAEKLAKERLIELNYDLGVHCRIPALVQPKVTFANNIQERATRGMDPSTS